LRAPKRASRIINTDFSILCPEESGGVNERVKTNHYYAGG
jgi:hypothetical protein